MRACVRVHVCGAVLDGYGFVFMFIVLGLDRSWSLVGVRWS